MAEKLLTEMSFDEMSELIDHYIERSSQQSGEMPVSSFFTLLLANLERRLKQTFEIEGRIINGQLQLNQPDTTRADIYVQNNQIIIGDQRIVVRLSPL